LTGNLDVGNADYDPAELHVIFESDRTQLVERVATDWADLTATVLNIFVAVSQ
jgi:hypothetical protein